MNLLCRMPYPPPPLVSPPYYPCLLFNSPIIRLAPLSNKTSKHIASRHKLLQYYSIMDEPFDPKTGRLKKLSIPKPGVEPIPGETVPYVCSFHKPSIVDIPESITCGYHLFARSVKAHSTTKCLGWRPIGTDGTAGPYTYVDFGETNDIVLKLGTALRAAGAQKGERIGVYGKNSPSWCITEIAVSSQGGVLVPVYDSLGPNTLEYIANHAELKIIFVSDENLPKYVEAAPKCPSVSKVVVFHHGDPREDNFKNFDAAHGINAVKFCDLIQSGVTDESKADPAGLDELFVIMYTSGTTGDPKGVMLPNKAMISTVIAMEITTEKFGITIGPDDSMYSYLPLAHIFAQQFELFMLYRGSSIAYFQGDIKLLLDDLMAAKPTVFPGVPRVYARFQEKIETTVKEGSSLKQKLFNWALHKQIGYINAGVGRSKLLDKIIFDKVKAKILPAGRFGITGSAPLSAETNDFLKVVLNMPIMQGYGLTESVGGMVCSAPYSKSGHCGGLIPVGEVKLVDVPEMNYLSTDKPFPRGEVLLKGANITSGYYKNEKATSEAFTEDGWFCTGDIGQIIEDGSLQIIDRKKNLFKLSQGEYVSPEQLEGEYAKCSLIAQIWVYGNSFENNLVAIVVPDMITSKKWATANGCEGASLADLAKKPEFKAAVMAELKDMRVKSKFKGYENIADLAFETNVNDLGQAFTVENDLMTPTFKFKRPKLLAQYKETIEAMYDGLKK